MAAITESWASTPGTAKSMRSNRGRDTSLELRVRRELHRCGLRYRVDVAPLLGLRSRADVVFTRRRVAVYLDGCFWHGCPTHGATPVAHSDYWLPKLARNRERDTHATRALEEAGWVVLRFWEHEETAAVVEAIQSVVARQCRVVRHAARFGEHATNGPNRDRDDLLVPSDAGNRLTSRSRHR